MSIVQSVSKVWRLGHFNIQSVFQNESTNAEMKAEEQI